MQLREDIQLRVRMQPNMQADLYSTMTIRMTASAKCIKVARVLTASRARSA